MDTARLRYFAACNSERGFHSFYRDVFSEELTNIYIIKGGPGTGKSSLMRRVADAAEPCGFCVEEIYCSSDPESLDGVIARGEDRSFAVLDGTAPHVTEMELPGARDEIISIGDFWSESRLREQRHEISSALHARAKCYQRLYRYLQAAGQCERNMESSVIGLIDFPRLEEDASDLLDRYPSGDTFSQKIMLLSSIGMRGLHRFSTWEEHSDVIYEVHDCGGVAYRLYDILAEQARMRRMRVWISYDPLIPSHIDGICLPDCRLSFVTVGANKGRRSERARRISLKQYLNMDEYRAVSHEAEMAKKCRARMMNAALDTLQDIRTLHFSLEQRYAAAMNFEAMTRYTDHWIEEILM